jgi:hypothetical protein
MVPDGLAAMRDPELHRAPPWTTIGPITCQPSLSRNSDTRTVVDLPMLTTQEPGWESAMVVFGNLTVARGQSSFY